MSITLAQRAQMYRNATEAVEDRRETLYTAIRKAHGNGASLRAIAAETGLSFARIHQIVKRP